MRRIVSNAEWKAKIDSILKVKRLPEAAHNYSITELEMCGLAINIASFAHFIA